MDPPPVDQPPDGAVDGADRRSWFVRELDRLGPTRPWTVRALRWLTPRPAVLLIPLAALTAAAVGAPSDDSTAFRAGGLVLWGPHPWQALADPFLQVGPVYLALVGALHRLVELVVADPQAASRTVAAALGALVTALALDLTDRLARHTGADGLAARWVVGTALAIGGLVCAASFVGHQEELLVAVVLGHASLFAVSGRRGRAGLLIGLATGLKPWGAIGVGLLATGRGRGLGRGLVTCAAVVALLYAPFVLWGTVGTFAHSWGFASSDSPAGALIRATGMSDWTMRAVQGSTAAGAAAGCAAMCPRSPVVPVIAGIAARLLTDPLRFTYYLTPLSLLIVVWVWTSAATTGRARRVVLTVTAVLFVALPEFQVAGARGLGTVLLLAAALGPAIAEHRSMVPQHTVPA